MRVVLEGIEWKFCLVYLDDILVCSSLFKKHIEQQKVVSEHICMAGLTLKPRKDSFAQNHAVYLEHVISVGASFPNPETNKSMNFLFQLI